MRAHGLTAIRGRLLSFDADPSEAGISTPFTYVEDGLVTIRHGVITAVGEASLLLRELPDGTPIDHFPDKLVMAGFIDLHIHYPQTRVIASYGAQLLDWLQKYTFVEEQKYRDPAHAGAGADFFIDELLRNGTTTAAVYCSVHAQSVDAFFEASERRGTCMIAGKVMMDRNAPPGLLDTPRSGHDGSEALLRKWHGRGRQLYAISPRFAITSTEEQLHMAGLLARRYPDVYVQTHLCETLDEIAMVKSLFPSDESYTAVYARHGLLGPKTILGHCIHLSDKEISMLGASGSIAAFCPTSNLFLGSGLFDMARLRQARMPVNVGLATDVGGGTSYSMLRTAAEAYKVMQLQRQPFSALSAFDMMTRGNARLLGLADKIGRLAPGFDADIVVLGSRATPAMAHRMESIHDNLAEELFVLMTLGDDRSVAATYVAGRCVTASRFSV